MYYDRVRYRIWTEEISFDIQEPINWDEDNKKFSRNANYHGISVSIAEKLKFTGDAYDFLVATLRDKGVNADVKLTREIKNANDEWELDYEGWVDFLSSKRTERIFEVSFFADPLTNRFKSKQTSKVELERKDDLDGNTLPSLNIDTLYVEGRAILVTSKLTHSEEPEFFIQSDNDIEHIKPFDIQETGDLNSGVQYINGQLENNERYWNQQLLEAENFVIVNDTTETFTYKVQLKHKQSFFWYSLERPNVFKIRLSVYENLVAPYDFVSTQDIYTYINTDGEFPTEIDIVSDELTVVIAPGQSACIEYYLRTEEPFELFASYPLSRGTYWTNLHNVDYNRLGYFVKPDGSWAPAYIETSVSVQEDTVRPPSNTPCIRIHEFFERLCRIALSCEVESTTLGRDGLREYTDDGFLSDFVLVNGMWLRGMKAGVDKYKPISTSLKDFLTSLDAVSPIGIDFIGGKVILEDRGYFYQKKVTVILGEVIDFEEEHSEMDFNTKITVGYSKAGGYEEDQGLDEYNRETEYGTILNKTDNEIAMISKFRADPYGLETVRRDNPDVGLNVDEDKDSKFDDEIWFVDANEQAEGTTLEVSSWSKRFAKAPKGVYSPETAFNLWLSPINILLRHGAWIKPGLLSYLDSYIRYHYSEGNSRLSTQLLGGPEYSQNVGLPVIDLDVAQHKGKFVTFRAEVTWEQLNGKTDGIKNYYGLIEFYYKGERFRGFLMDVSLKDGVGTFKVKLN